MMKPTKQIVPLAVGLAWQSGGLFQQKIDGKFATVETAGGILAGEDVRGNFTAFDCIGWRGADVRAEILSERLKMRNELCNAGQIQIVPEVTERGGEFLESILAAGGEGAVCKRLDATWFEPMLAAKRFKTWLCRVAAFNGGTQSVCIVDAASGQARGNLPLLGGKCDRVRVGSLLKVEGFGLHASGLIREGRVCRDTPDSWLQKF
jgi:hypothetical protein